ncbi:MAG TPA: acyl-CoA dehydrogenase family protein [Acidimicrobiales bacterium]|nr:acyl-CoA dehydrogenase family protein [Acidimicrobiales bacterium]
MDFELTEEERRFREDLQRLLAQELPEWWRGMFVEDERVMPFTKRFCSELAERGWLTMAWPPEHGGQGASVWQQAVLREEMWAADEPRGPQYMNLNYIGPLIMRFGTDAQKSRFLPPMARGEVIWCQGFSEPEAGSDLASLRTRAVADGDRFVINGQKVWTSYADSPAEWCLLLARSDPEAEKHRGISVFLLDMATPGVTVRPIATMAGPHEFNEVFLDDVVVGRDCLLGELHRGWDVVVTGLTFERVGIARYARAGRVIEMLVEHVRRTGRDSEPEVMDKLADLRVRYEAARLLNYVAISIQARGEVPTTEASVARIHNTQLEQLVGHVGLELLGAAGQLTHDDPASPLGGEIWRQWVRNIPTTVAAGTLEIQKNIVARALGLPRPA